MTATGSDTTVTARALSPTPYGQRNLPNQPPRELVGLWFMFGTDERLWHHPPPTNPGEVWRLPEPWVGDPTGVELGELEGDLFRINRVLAHAESAITVLRERIPAELSPNMGVFAARGLEIGAHWPLHFLSYQSPVQVVVEVSLIAGDVALSLLPWELRLDDSGIRR